MNDTKSEAAAHTYRIARLVDVAATMFRVLERSAGPVVDLLIRMWLAQMFFASAVVKLAHWNDALYLAAHEYPVAWMNPVAAAYLGVSIEFFGAALLAVGLATRFAAVSMLILAVVVQLNYVVLDSNLFQAALFGWFAVRGAGALSLDRLLSRGLGESALPLAASARHVLALFTRFGAPVYLLLMRIWAVGAIVVTGFAVAMPASANMWLPLASAHHFGSPLELTLASLILVGLGTRFAALALIIATGALHVISGGYADHASWLSLIALFALNGAGPVSLDALIDLYLRARFPQLEGKPAFSLDGLPRVVIVGAGFSGMACAAALSRARVAVTLIDRHNYHLFQPLLYQVATAGLSPGDIAAPVRGIFRDQFNVRVLLGEVTGIDTRGQTVLLQDRRVAYDYLVLATGAAHSYFGRDDWAPFAPGLKRVEDATEIRRRLLIAFEKAEATEDPSERQSLLTFVVVGGGPTGVELSGAIAELAKWGMENDFRRFDPAQARIILIQAGPRLLPTFSEDLSEAARKSLEKLGVEVFVNSRVECVDGEGATVNGQRVSSRTVLWAAGVIASPAAKWLGVEADNVGRVKVRPNLSVPGIPNVFVVGDTAASNAWDGNPVPGLAPAAKQTGSHAAKLIKARVEGRADPRPFVYRHLGSLATIGRKAAVADFGRLRLHGALAWWFWGAVHIGFLVDLRSRLSVMFHWAWAYLTYRSGARLIIGSQAGVMPVVVEAARDSGRGTSLAPAVTDVS